MMMMQNGRVSLGDALYRNITDVEFDPDEFLSSVDLTSEHKICDLKDRIEASVIIWNRKVHNKDGKSAWGSAVSQEKREQFEERAQTLLLIIKHRFPGIPQSTLDIAKIQENRVRINLLIDRSMQHMLMHSESSHDTHMLGTRTLVLLSWRATPGYWRALHTTSCPG
jgi:hypothetical protein